MVGESGHETKERTAVHVNALCLVALSLSVLSALAPWRFDFAGRPSEVWTVFDAVTENSFAEIRIWALLFLIGLLTLIITPLGGVLEAVGSAGAILAVSGEIGSHEIHRFFGEVLGLLAASLAILSICYPNGDLAHRNRVSFRERFLTVSIKKRSTSTESVATGWPIGMNLIAFTGLAIGLATIFVDWCSYQPGYVSGQREGISIVDSMAYGMGRWSGTIHDPEFALTFFAIGLIVSILSPLGATVQWAALLLFLKSMDDSSLREVHLEFGLALAIISCLVLITSILVPVYIGEGRRLPGIRKRILTFDLRSGAVLSDSAAETGGKGRVYSMVAVTLRTVNIVCLAGALVGLYALIPCLSNVGSESFQVVTPMGYTIFLIGTILAFVSPWGGFVQLFGLVMYDIFWFRWMSTAHPMILFEWTAIDFNIATASCFVVLLSMLLAFEFGRRVRETMLDRVLVFRFLGHLGKKSRLLGKQVESARMPKSV